MPKRFGKPHVISGAIAQAANTRSAGEWIKAQILALGGNRVVGNVSPPSDPNDYPVPYAPALAKAKAKAQQAKAAYKANPTAHHEIAYNQALRAVKELLTHGNR